MQASSEELQLLAQVGFMGAARGDVAAAAKIFSAIELERPGALVTFIGPAIAHLHAGQAAEAISCLERAEKVVAPEERPELYAFLGLAYQVDGQMARSFDALRKAPTVPFARSLLAGSPSRGVSPA